MSDADRSLVQRGAGLAVELFEWIRDSLASDEARKAILQDLGVEVTSSPPLAIPDEKLDSIDLYRKRQDADFGAFVSAFGDIVTVLEAIDSFIASNASAPREVIEEQTLRLVTLLGTDYMRLRHPFVFYLAQFARVFLDRPEQVEDALSVMKTPEDVETASHAVLLPIALALSYIDLGLPTPSILYGWDVGGDSPTPVGDALSRGMFSLQVQGKKSDKNGGSVTGKLGVTVAPLSESDRAQFQLDARQQGVLVTNVVPGGPAWNTLSDGDRGGGPDVILEVEGKSVKTPADVRRALSGAKPGEVVSLRVYNTGAKNRRVERIKLGE